MTRRIESKSCPARFLATGVVGLLVVGGCRSGARYPDLGDLYNEAAQHERPDLKFDIVAHSMGALLTRYYLRYGTADLPQDGSLPELTWAGAEHIERVVMVAPPNAGAGDALLDLVAGRKFGFLGPRYEPALLGTFPSMY